MIDIIEFNNIMPVICISKYDLLDNTEEMDKIIEYYKTRIIVWLIISLL